MEVFLMYLLQREGDDLLPFLEESLLYYWCHGVWGLWNDESLGVGLFKRQSREEQPSLDVSQAPEETDFILSLHLQL